MRDVGKSHDSSYTCLKYVRFCCNSILYASLPVHDLTYSRIVKFDLTNPAFAIPPLFFYPLKITVITKMLGCRPTLFFSTSVSDSSINILQSVRTIGYMMVFLIRCDVFSFNHRRKVNYKVAQKSKPLPNYQNIVLNRIKACQ